MYRIARYLDGFAVFFGTDRLTGSLTRDEARRIKREFDEMYVSQAA